MVFHDTSGLVVWWICTDISVESIAAVSMATYLLKVEAACPAKTLVYTYKSTCHLNAAHCSLLTTVKIENNVTRCLLFSATDVNDTFDDDEADPEYNVLADEEKETGENLPVFSQWWIISCDCDLSEWGLALFGVRGCLYQCSCSRRVSGGKGGAVCSVSKHTNLCHVNKSQVFEPTTCIHLSCVIFLLW